MLLRGRRHAPDVDLGRRTLQRRAARDERERRGDRCGLRVALSPLDRAVPDAHVRPAHSADPAAHTDALIARAARYTGMVRPCLVVLAIVVAACGGAPNAPSPSSPPAVAATNSPSVAPSPSPSPTPRPISAILERIDPAKLNDHMVALASFGSRDPRHANDAKAVAYL